MNKKFMGIFLAFAVFAMPLCFATDVDASVTVGNAAPTVTNVALSAATLDPTPNSTSTIYVNFTATDANGYADISTIAVQQNAGGYSSINIGTYCAGNGNDYTCTNVPLTRNYYDAAGNVQVDVKATDSQADFGTNNANYTYNELVSMNVPSTIPYGSGSVGQTKDVTQSYYNFGNVVLNANVTGANLVSGGNTIGVGNATLNATALTTSPQEFAFGLTAGAGNYESVLYQLYIPTVPSGLYTGTYTVVAHKA